MPRPHNKQRGNQRIIFKKDQILVTANAFSYEVGHLFLKTTLWIYSG